MEKLSQKEVDAILQKCINLARRKPPEFFSLKKMKKYMGLYNVSDIVVDPRRDFIGTAIHECIHHIYPNWSETQVLYAESRILNSGDLFDIARFLKYLSLKIYKTESQKYTQKKKKKKPHKPLKIKRL